MLILGLLPSDSAAFPWLRDLNPYHSGIQVEANSADRRFVDVWLSDQPRPGPGRPSWRGRDPGPVVVACRTCDDGIAALRRGAAAVLLPADSTWAFTAAVHAAAAGQVLVSPELAARCRGLVLDVVITRPLPGGDALTQQERNVLRLLATGMPNAAIANGLSIGRTTVNTHVLNILRKFGAANRTEAVAIAFRRGLVDPARAPAALAET